jgi:hypothetical protein
MRIAKDNLENVCPDYRVSSKAEMEVIRWYFSGLGIVVLQFEFIYFGPCMVSYPSAMVF